MIKPILSRSIFFVFFTSFNLFAQQGGGMWIPTELNEKEMKEMGLKISSADIFSTGDKSINNAIAHFGNGCTSEVISPNGLLLTNHHCGYGQIQAHSSLENDYLTDGFWAKDLKDELPNHGLTATFIVNIKDVSSAILKGINTNTPEEKRTQIIKNNIDSYNNASKIESYQTVFIKPFYKGNKYYQFTTETYNDVRLVGAPPSAVGKYGQDTDNWVWPRHTGDFSIFRIYADTNNKPADYSPENIPYKPKHFLPIKISGIKENDFTFVYGFPGATDEYLPASSIEQIKNVIDPARINVRSIALSHIDKKMRLNDATRIAYASKQARISNAHKKWIGEVMGLNRSNAVEKRKEYEKEFLNRLSKNRLHKDAYGNIINELNELNKVNQDYALANTLYAESFNLNSETFKIALSLNNVLEAIGKSNYNEIKNKTLTSILSIYKDYDTELDKAISIDILENYFKEIPAKLHPNTTKENVKKALENSFINGTKKIGSKSLIDNISILANNDLEFINTLKKDELISQIKLISEANQTKVQSTYTINQEKINRLLRNYMKAQMDVFPDKKIFPDANSTLRVTYGKVKGYKPKDAVYYEPFTYTEGVIEKYIPNDYEYNLPKQLLQLYENKDFGKYADKNDKLAVNFIATNHTTGGNSGSPALDAKGNLIGLNFDRVWEGTMSDLNYDPEICRNIMVDSRYILWVIDKYANAKRLIDEIKIIDQ